MKLTYYIDPLTLWFISGLIFFGALFCYCLYRHQYIELPASYRAWVKQTDNPKHLTFDEWNSLRRVMHENPVIITR